VFGVTSAKPDTLQLLVGLCSQSHLLWYQQQSSISSSG